MSFIELKNVTYRYPYTKEPALKNINLSFEKGKFYGIVGENGGGKTTLCNLVRGLIPHFYEGSLEGDVIVDGKDIRSWDTSELGVKIGYIFQNPFTQISGIKPTVFEEIAMGLENMGVPKDEIIERVMTVCEKLKIENLIKMNPNNISGGQRQRVAFASIMVMDMPTMVIDEPTSQLDPEGTKDVFEIIDELKESNKTIILIEHKMDLIAEYCDEVIVVENGAIAFNGPTDQILSNPEIMNHGAVMPEVVKFGIAMQKAGKPLSHIPVTIEDAINLIKEREEKYGN